MKEFVALVLVVALGGGIISFSIWAVLKYLDRKDGVE